MSRQVYKIADECLITLEIPLDAKTNESRVVRHKKTAKYRCNKAFVLLILDLKNGNYCKSIPSDYDSHFIYKVGEFVEENDYDEDNFEVCAPGIHYFLTVFGAFIYSQLHMRTDDGFKPGKKLKRRFKKRMHSLFK